MSFTTSHSLDLPLIPTIVSVPAPLYAAHSPPGTPKLTAETPLLSATSHHRTAGESRQRAVRFSVSPSPRPRPGQSAVRVRLARPDDLQPTPFPSPAFIAPVSIPVPIGRHRRSLSPLTELGSADELPTSPTAAAMFDSPSDSSSSASYEEPIVVTIIEKPPGEVSRPGRGGYNLQRALIGTGNWDSKGYEQFKVILHSKFIFSCLW